MFRPVPIDGIVGVSPSDVEYKHILFHVNFNLLKQLVNGRHKMRLSYIVNFPDNFPFTFD